MHDVHHLSEIEEGGREGGSAPQRVTGKVCVQAICLRVPLMPRSEGDREGVCLLFVGGCPAQVQR